MTAQQAPFIGKYSRRDVKRRNWRNPPGNALVIFASLCFFHPGLVCTCGGTVLGVIVGVMRVLPTKWKSKIRSYKHEGIQACRKNQNRSIFFQLHFHCDVYYPMKTKLSGLQPEAEELTHHKTCLLFTNNPVSSEHRQWSWKFFVIYLFSFFWLILQKQVAKHLEYLSIPGVPGLNNAWKKSDTTRASQQGAHESCCHKYIQYKFHESYIHPHWYNPTICCI